MIEETEPEPLLSPELLEELGCTDESILVKSSKKKEKRKRSEEPSEEVMLLAKKMSKSEQKRVDQITLRKEKEAKRADYLKIIHDNAITDSQRLLFTSTNDIGQTQTLKQLLSSILKKQKAGLALTEEEMNLLYKEQGQPDEDDAMMIPQFPQTETPTIAAAIETDNKVDEVDEGGGLMFSFDSLVPVTTAAAAPAKNPASKKAKSTVVTSTAANEEEVEESVEQAKVKKGKKSKGAAAATVGTGLLAQLANLKNKLHTNAAAAAADKKSTSQASSKKNTKGLTKTVVGAAAIAGGKNKATTGGDADEEYSDSDDSSSGGDDEKEFGDDAENVEEDEEAPQLVAVPPPDRTSLDHYLAGKAKYTPKETVVPMNETTGEIIPPPAAAATEGTDPELTLKKSLSERKVVFSVRRPHEISLARMNLPVCGMEQEIVEAVNNHDVVILCGETGSGKSTQVPQFLYEAGYANNGRLVGITQPRRVAVTSTANRVAYEMGVMDKTGKYIVNTHSDDAASTATDADNGGATSGGGDADKVDKKSKKSSKKAAAITATKTVNPDEGCLVGYQIRFDSSTVGSETKIKFMTDGILLREITHDLLLRQYNVVILDEAHERNINTDVLLGLISRTLPLRRAQSEVEVAKWNKLSGADRARYEPPLQPLKLVIMSATMRVTDFQNPRLFPSAPPIIMVEARQYPVTTHFSKRTELKNYLQATHKKVCQIHRKLPDGGVLVFLTGKREILYMCHKLSKSLNKSARSAGAARVVSLSGTGVSDMKLDISSGAAASGSGGSAAVSGSEKVATNNDDKAFVSLGGMDETNEDGDESGSGGGGDIFADETEHDHEQEQAAVETTKKSNSNKKSDKNKSSRSVTAAEVEAPEIALARMYSAYGSLRSSSGGGGGGGGGGRNNANDKSASVGEGGGFFEEQDEIVTDDDDSDVGGDDDDEDEEEEEEDEKEGEVILTSNNVPAADESVRDRMLREALNFGQNPVAPLPLSEQASPVEPTTANTMDVKNTNPDGTAVPTVTPAAGQSVAVEEGPPDVPLKALILPLYAMMPPALQARIFAAVPEGYRLIVVATNVAETSITIPNIRYVVDCGRQKEKVQSTSSAIAKYEVKFISKASADQRQGRSGRTGPGHCYRLYSANFYHQYMPQFQPPEIMNTPLEDLILQMKSIGIDHIESFPFPTAPPSVAVQTALLLLTHLGAVYTAATANTSSANQILDRLDKLSNMAKGNKKALAAIEDTRGLTPLGQRLVKFPVNPRYAKMLVITQQEYPHLLPYVLTLVATLAEKSVFTMGDESVRLAATGAEGGEDDDDQEDDHDHDQLDDHDRAGLARAAKEAKATRQKLLCYHEHGDALARLRAAGAYMYTVSQHVDRMNTQNKAVQLAMQSATAAEVQLIKHKQLKYHLKNKANAAVPSVSALCEAQHLHQPTLRSIMELRGQLHDICETMLPTSADDSTHGAGGARPYMPISVAPPYAQDEVLLRKILLRGYCDSIAKLVPLKVITEGSHLKRTTAYFSCNPAVTQPLYIHPASNLYDRNHDSLPKYIMYGSLLLNRTGDTTYMTCNTIVDEKWLAALAEDCPLLTYSAPLTSPTPSYDAASDTVMCYVTPSYGARHWSLPSVQRPLYEYSLKALVSYSSHDTEGNAGKGQVSLRAVQMAAAAENSVPIGYRKIDEAYRWFARLLLEGSIRLFVHNNPLLDAALRKMFAEIKTRGSAAVITERKPEPRVSELLRALINKEVRSVSALKGQLRLNGLFLCEEIQPFIPIAARSEFRKAWLRLVTK